MSAIYQLLDRIADKKEQHSAELNQLAFGLNRIGGTQAQHSNRFEEVDARFETVDAHLKTIIAMLGERGS